MRPESGSPRGIIVPTLTPLTSDEALDGDALERHLRFLIDAQVDGLFILGSNGEGAMLRASTRMDVVRESVRIAAGRLPVICGILDISTARVVEQVQALAGMGIAGYVVTTPLYFDGYAETDLRDHFREIATRADAPVILYNIPQFAGISLSESLVRSLADDPNIVGLKDSSGNWTTFQRLVLDRPSRGFSLLQGFHALSAVSLFIGADGLVPGYANLHPALFVNMVRAVAADRRDEALTWQAQLDRLLSFRGPAALHANKVIGKALGLMDDHVTSPLPRLDERTARQLVDSTFDAGLPGRDLTTGVATRGAAGDPG